ncbi:hypothetical protein SDC9_152795 [bioreactor metagenome]|uniref:Uncharacterized protein n=1 Tax=bioreactor metagenome TaxID=1076179 RepID=A0A645EYR0_9ZZZZ
MMGIDGQGKQRKTLAGTGELFELLPRFIQYRIVIEAPVIAVIRIGDDAF